MGQQRSLTTVQPSGMVAMFANSTAPSGWLKCNGQAISRTDYSDLFNAIGTTYGTGNGSTTFNVPDLRGEFLRGWDDGRTVDNGRTFASAQSAGVTGGTVNVVIPLDGNWPTGGTVYNAPGWIASPYNGAEGHAVVYKLSGSRTITSSVTVSDTKPRNVALLCCIKI